MCGISKHVVYRSERVETIAEHYDPRNPYPKGTLLEVSINPYNGAVVFAWQDNAKARSFIQAILNDLDTKEFRRLINDPSCVVPEVIEVDLYASALPAA